MKPRFPIGLQFQRYNLKYPRLETIVDIYTTTNLAGEVVQIEYITTHDFMGQPVTGRAVDTTIARSLPPEIFNEYRG